MLQLIALVGLATALAGALLALAAVRPSPALRRIGLWVGGSGLTIISSVLLLVFFGSALLD